MVRPPSIDSNGMKKGAWSEDEDNKLRAYIQRYGHWNWRLLPKYAGLKRCGKSCRLRWVNYLKPGVRRGNFTKEEQDIVIKLHLQLGNKWSAIAAKLPGRTDNEVKNFWHTRVEKRRKLYPTPTPAPATKKPITISEEASSFMNINFDSSEAMSSSLTTSQHLSSLPSDHAHADVSLSTNSQDQLDLMLSDLLDTNYDVFAPHFEEEAGFYYPDFHHTELSSSGSSSYMNNWTAEDEDNLINGSFWNESSTSIASNSSECESSDYTERPQGEGLPPYFDPLLQYDYFHYDMNSFCYQP